MTFWQTFSIGNNGSYEYEYDECCRYTGWCRCVGGRMADGRWPEWNYLTGARRYS